MSHEDWKYIVQKYFKLEKELDGLKADNHSMYYALDGAIAQAEAGLKGTYDAQETLKTIYDIILAVLTVVPNRSQQTNWIKSHLGENHE